MEPSAVFDVNFNNACPVCNGDIHNYVILVQREGLSKFRTDTFINNPSGVITPTVLVKKLSVFPDVRHVVYNRSRSVKCPPMKYINVTVLQLIASGLI